ncbi:hypothetical protein M3Y99_00614500 [Aphelenchoides fujianensis]|nr:hypothetical protein M3Y99_00614500 [Aphelenchoides fujianensis]
MEKQLAKRSLVASFYVLLLLVSMLNAVEADLENTAEEPQPKRGNNALLSRYGRALLSRYGKRSGYAPVYEHRILNDYEAAARREK